MKKLLLVVVIAMISFVSCNDDDTGLFKSTYELRFTCTSDNPYLVEVNGYSNIVSGNSYKNYYLKKGTYAWRVEQQSGYVLYPTVKEGTVNLDQDKEIIFP